MRVSIFGLGYVGLVSAVCLAREGHVVIGIDANLAKNEMIRGGVSPIIEAQVPELLKEAVDSGMLTIVDEPEAAIRMSDATLVCVGTPSRHNGSLNTAYLENVCAQIGAALRSESRGHIVVFRSTMLPGTVRELLIPILESHAGKREGVGFHVAVNPEFLRESTAVADFGNPPKTVVGCDDPATAQTILTLYARLPGPKIVCRLRTAEMVKYVDNNFHALKITFANEIGMLCKTLGIDSDEVMEIFKQDEKLNISRAYLSPGFAFGGSCLPKDLRAINYLAKIHDLELPVLGAILRSNGVQIFNSIDQVLESGFRKIGIAGLSFKEGTDDLRESPLVEVIETLIGKGCDIRIYDRNVSMSRLLGANRDFIETRIPHVASLLVDSLDTLARHADLLIIGTREKEFMGLLNQPGKNVLDLVRLDRALTSGEHYEGLYW